MNRFFIIGMLCLFSFQVSFGQVFPETNSRKFVSDSVTLIPRRPWVAAGEVVGINLLVGSFNRFIMHEDFAMDE